MTIIQQFTSILLAILMANPGCCCSLKKIFSPSESQPIPSCCSTPTPSDDSEPSDCPDCPCEKFASAHEAESTFHLGADYSIELVIPDPEHLVAHFPTPRPPQNAPPENESPPPVLWLLFESFLL